MRDVRGIRVVQPSVQLPAMKKIVLAQHHDGSNAWDVLEHFAGTVDAPADWSSEHDHYLYGTPKRKSGNPTQG